MKAMVCDKCGKVILLADDNFVHVGINTLYMRRQNREIDLCDDCVEELEAAVRKENGYD